MSYVKIKDQAVNINSTKNILLRQEWARQFLAPSLENKHWLNIDESWLNMMDFRRRAWTPKHASSSLSKRIANPRISLTLCISSRGRVYYSLSQANNNSQTISLFMRELCLVLDQEDRGWRKHTVVLMDNAPYHTSYETKLAFQHLKVPVMFLAPYSFDVAPCELFFAILKSSNLNPEDLSLGKR